MLLQAFSCGVGGAEIDGTIGVGERRLWLTRYGDLMLLFLPTKENKMDIPYVRQQTSSDMIQFLPGSKDWETKKKIIHPSNLM